MKKFLNNRKKTTITLSIFAAVAFFQALVIAKLWSERTDKTYEVNLVKINTQKDSIDYLKMKNDLVLVDNTVRDLNSFLASKNISNTKIEMLEQDSLSSSIYLAKQSNRYSQYLVDLQNQLQQVPLGMPTDGYISSNFGNRKNPIPYKTVLASAGNSTAKPTSVAPVIAPARRKVISARIVEEKDSLGNIKKVVIPIYADPEPAPTNAPATATITAIPSTGKKQTVREVNNVPAEADQIQFHKGLDIAVAYGSDVKCAAAGTVIFAGEKGGYGKCVIVSHGNGLATLYGHLSQLLVAANDKVKVNQVIAKTGNTGRSTGPHLHYEVHKNNTPVNPKLFINF